MPPKITPVILAGGEGRRLWPLTSASRPKPFLKLFSQNSLLQETVRRVSGFLPPVVVSHHYHGEQAMSELLAAGVQVQHIICEPVGRSTAPAIALAALVLEYTGHAMLVLPSDHYVQDSEAFRASVTKAAAYLSDNNLIILGVRPESADPRYGYIRTAKHKSGVHEILSFIEKPERTMAEALYKEPSCFWNSGIFLIRPAYYLSLLKTFEPAVFAAAQAAYDNRSEDEPFIYPDFDPYIEARSVSVDHAVMERCKSALLMPLETGWRDIGCWSALLQVKLKTLGLAA